MRILLLTMIFAFSSCSHFLETRSNREIWNTIDESMVKFVTEGHSSQEIQNTMRELKLVYDSNQCVGIDDIQINSEICKAIGLDIANTQKISSKLYEYKERAKFSKDIYEDVKDLSTMPPDGLKDAETYQGYLDSLNSALAISSELKLKFNEEMYKSSQFPLVKYKEMILRSLPEARIQDAKRLTLEALILVKDNQVKEEKYFQRCKEFEKSVMAYLNDLTKVPQKYMHRLGHDLNSKEFDELVTIDSRKIGIKLKDEMMNPVNKGCPSYKGY